MNFGISFYISNIKNLDGTLIGIVLINLSPQLKEMVGLLYGFPAVYRCLETLSRQWSGAIVGLNFVHYLSLRDHCPFFPADQYLENNWFIYIVHGLDFERQKL